MTDKPQEGEFPDLAKLNLRASPAADKSLPFEVRLDWVREHLGLRDDSAGVLLAILDGRPYGDVIRAADLADGQQNDHPDNATDSR